MRLFLLYTHIRCCIIDRKQWMCWNLETVLLNGQLQGGIPGLKDKRENEEKGKEL